MLIRECQDDVYRIINVKSERVKTTLTELLMLIRESQDEAYPNYQQYTLSLS